MAANHQESKVNDTQPLLTHKPLRRANPEIVILFGSETGTGEEIAERLASQALCFRQTPTLSSMNDYLNDWIGLVEKGDRFVSCFVCSTTGQGDVPSQMIEFWNYLLRKSLPSDCLKKVHFTVLGLGDSSYAKYNCVGKKLYKRLLQLGGRPLTELFLGDDQHDLGPEAVVTPWMNEIWKTLYPDKAAREPNGFVPLPRIHPQPKFLITKQRPIIPKTPPAVLKFQCEQFKLVERERVTAVEHFQDVKLFTFDMSESSQKYDPGDILVVLPHNLEESVQLFYELFPAIKVKSEEQIYILKNPKKPWAQIPLVYQKLYPQPWTWDFVVRHYFDLQMVPRKIVFELLRDKSGNETEKSKLEEFCSAEGQQDLFSYCNRPKRTVLEVLQDFPFSTKSFSLSEDLLFDLFTPIKPRSFSIASSMRQDRKLVQILFAIVEYKTKLKLPRLGLCSNYLKRLELGDQVPCWIKRGSFEFPLFGPNAPVIMIGPGTGCAPFNSYISEVHGFMDHLILFFGCRNKEKDFFFEKQWKNLVEKDELQLFLACSRDSSDGRQMYVQDKMEEVGQFLWKLIHERGGSIYVAGNAKRMPIDVRDQLMNIFMRYGGVDEEVYMKQLVKQNRYQTEVWS